MTDISKCSCSNRSSKISICSTTLLLKYASPQSEQISAGTFLITATFSPIKKGTVVFPSWSSPPHRAHRLTLSVSPIILPPLPGRSINSNNKDSIKILIYCQYRVYGLICNEPEHQATWKWPTFDNPIVFDDEATFESHFDFLLPQLVLPELFYRMK